MQAIAFYLFALLGIGIALPLKADAPPILHPEHLESLSPGATKMLPQQKVQRSRSGSHNAIVLDMNLYHQEQSQWCWAAVSQAVVELTKGLVMEQCQVVSKVLFDDGSEYCCEHPTSSDCNHGYKIYHSLPKFGALRVHLQESVSLVNLSAEIDAGTPVPVRIAWNQGDAHYIMVYGYEGDRVYVFDPIAGELKLTINELRNYRQRGRWVETYYTH